MLRLKDLLALSTVTSLLACAGGEEQQLLNRFFMACRTADNATIAAVSLVNFPGGQACESWELIEVSQEATEPFRLTELRQKVTDAKKERDVQFEKGKYFLEDNYSSIEKIQLQLEKDPDAKFTGKLGEVHAEWEKIIQQRKELERNVQDLQREMERELRLAKMSLMADVPLDKLQGDVLKKIVRVQVTSGGQAKPYTFTMQRYNLSNPEANVKPGSRWIIVNIEEQAG